MRVVFMCATFYDTESSLFLRKVKWNTFPIFTSLIFHGMIIRLFVQESHHRREQTKIANRQDPLLKGNSYMILYGNAAFSVPSKLRG